MSETLHNITDGAKAFLGTGKAGTTQTHETVAPAVTQERVQKSVHEQTQVVEDREHHITHYQQRVQPIADRQVDAEVHRHNTVAVEERVHHQELSDGAKKALNEQQNAYKDSRTVLPTTHTKETLAAVGQDVTHHHVIEQIVPVIQRDVYQPEVVHTTIPVHSVDHSSVVHQSTTEPVMSLADFQAKGGNLSGTKTVDREVRQGEPAIMTGDHHDAKHAHTNAVGTVGHDTVAK